MIAQPFDLVFDLLRDILLEVVGAGLPFVAEHEVLPDHDAEFVAEGVELVGLVITAAPVTDHVHVGSFGRLKDAAILRGGDAGWKTVERNNVGSLGEYRNAVHD